MQIIGNLLLKDYKRMNMANGEVKSKVYKKAKRQI